MRKNWLFLLLFPLFSLHANISNPCRNNAPAILFGVGPCTNAILATENDRSSETKISFGLLGFVGYAFNRQISVEGAFLYAGRTNNTEIATASFLATTKTRTWLTILRGHYAFPITCWNQLFLSLGTHYYFQDNTAPSPHSLRIRRSGLGMNYGVGFEHFFSFALSTRLAVNRYTLSNWNRYKTTLEWTICYAY